MTMQAQDQVQSQAAVGQMLQLLNAHFLVQALHVAATLGIADLLTDEAMSIDDLAGATGAQSLSLYRILRALASVGVFREEQTGYFALTPLGTTLRSEGPASVRDWALFVAAPAMWETLGNLRHSVLTGESAFRLTHHVPIYEYMVENPDLGTPFNSWMTRQSEQHNAAIVASYDFSSLGTVVDVGGGQGATLTAILQSHPALRGILFDLPEVVAQATTLQTMDVRERCAIVGGDFLQSVPAGGNAYIIKRVLLDQPDDAAAQVLRNCRAAMANHGRVLVVDLVIPPGNEPSAGKVLDLLMLACFGRGRARTAREFGELFTTAGLRLTQIIATPSPNSIIEGVPV